MAQQVPLDDLFPFIQPAITSCPNGVVRSAILRAAIQFCKDSLAWSEWQDMIPVSNTIHTFEIDLPAKDCHLVAVREIWASNRELTPKNMAEIARMMPDWQTSQGDPQYYNQPSATEVRLFPIPVNQQVGTMVTIRAAFAPTVAATTLHPDLVNLYFEAITHGATYLLMSMPKQPWTDIQLADFHRNAFLTEIDKTKIEMLKDRTVSSNKVTPRKFGG